MNINEACEAFKKLLEEQQARIANMSTEKTDFTTKKVVTIGVIDGDGIGPIITKEATRVLEKLLADEIAAGSIVVSFVLSMIVMYDAMNVRMQTGKQAKLLNRVFFENILEFDGVVLQERLKEYVGHTPVQVVAGAIVGIVIAGVVSGLY